MRPSKCATGLNQLGGGFPAIEMRIVVFLVMLGMAILIANLQQGFWKALVLALEWEGGIVGGFFGLIFLIVGIGKLVQRLFPKPPQ